MPKQLFRIDVAIVGIPIPIEVVGRIDVVAPPGEEERARRVAERIEQAIAEAVANA